MISRRGVGSIGVSRQVIMTAIAALVVGAVVGIAMSSAMTVGYEPAGGDTTARLGPSTERGPRGALQHSQLVPGDLGTNAEVQPIAASATLSATLEGGRFELTGVVPDPVLAARIRETVGTIYGADIYDSLAVDPRVSGTSWLPVADDVVASLPIISNGGLHLTGDVVTITGIAGSSTKHEQFRSAVSEIVGPTIRMIDEVVVEQKESPSLVIRKSDAHTIEVTGLVPDDELRDEIEMSLNTTYAGYSLNTQIDVDSSVEDTFALHSLPLFAELFFGFPAWELRYVDETIESSSSGSAAFEPGSANVPPLGAQILDNVAVRLAGTPGLVLTVEGHTDAQGDADSNQVLSEERADAVVAYLVNTHGIDPSRLHAIGYGETRPIDDNATGEGRTRNRRVDFQFVEAGLG